MLAVMQGASNWKQMQITSMNDPNGPCSSLFSLLTHKITRSRMRGFYIQGCRDADLWKDYYHTGFIYFTYEEPQPMLSFVACCKWHSFQFKKFKMNNK